MELALLLRELWRLRLLVAIGAGVALLAAFSTVYNVGFLPPSVSSRSLQYSTAKTQILVDSPRSAIADLDQDLNSLVVRAGVYSRFLTSRAALEEIGREAKIDPGLIYAQGPFELNQPRIEQEPTAEKRSGQLLGESTRYRLRYESSTDLPIVTIFAQAPTTDEAIALASGAARGLGIYVERIQARQQIPPKQAVEITQLGDAVGGVVNKGANLQVGVLVFVAVLGVWCVILLVGGRLVEAWRVTAPGPTPPVPTPPGPTQRSDAHETAVDEMDGVTYDGFQRELERMP
jgi:hypothetical protein